MSLSYLSLFLSRNTLHSFVAIHNIAFLPVEKSFPCDQFAMLGASMEEMVFITS